MTTETIYLLSAEIVLVAVASAIYLAGAFLEGKDYWGRVAVAGLLAAAAALGIASGGGRSGPLLFDSLSTLVRWMALTAGLMLALMSLRPVQLRGLPEYVGSLLLSIAGLMLAASADDLVLLFVGLELISIPTYILLYLGRPDWPSREATAKYFYLSILASALLLYGFSFLYGLTGSTDLATISSRLAAQGGNAARLAPLAKAALILIFAGLGFRMTAVPFHFYAPDVYEGTTHTNAALLSVVPKIAGLVVLVRIVAVAMPNVESYGWRIALALSLVTMTLGNVLALWQDNLRRLLAYSSIAHAGYLLIGLAVRLAGPAAPGSWDGVAALLFYLCVYSLATVGTFAALAYLGRPQRQLDGVEELVGLGRTRPLPALAIAVFMFSLTGIPPLAGFFGKLFVFGSALGVDAGAGAPGNPHPWFVALAVAGVLNSAISAAYYLRIVGVMYFRTPLGTPRAEGGPGPWLVMTTCTVLVIALGLYSGPLARRSTEASPPLRTAAAEKGVPAPSQTLSSVLPGAEVCWKQGD